MYIGGMAFFQTKHLWVKPIADDVAVLVLDRAQGAANVLDRTLLDDLDRALEAIAGESRFRLLVLRSAKAGQFCVGPGHADFLPWKPSDYVEWSRRGQEVCNRLAELKVPSVCVIAGSCFDVGLELALACDYRIVVQNATTSLGFPELEWGMIPCWGGTQRLAHTVGLDGSLDMLLSGQRLDARAAWAAHLADELAETDDDPPPDFLANPFKRDRQTFPRFTWRQRWLESHRLGRWLLFRGAERVVRTRIPEEMPAPQEMLQALRVAFDHPDPAASLAFEQKAVERIATHPAVHNMLRMLTHRETLRASDGHARSGPEIRQVGVLGSGPVGASLVLHSVVSGFDAVLRAENEQALGTALTNLIQILQGEVQRGAMSAPVMKKLLGRIRGTYTWNHFDAVDLVLDTTEGDLDAKRALIREVEQEVPAKALLVPMTACHRIADLRAGLSHPERVVGLHVLEPWNRAGIAEIVTADAAPGRGESSAAARRLRDWAHRLGKPCLEVPDAPGGLVLRVWLPALNEAGVLLKEGVPVERIDRAMTRFGMTYGPCEWMDRLGIDRIAAVAAALQPQFAGRIPLETGFGLMAKRGWTGNQGEQGFYRTLLRRPVVNPEVIALWQKESQGSEPRPVPAMSETDAQHWIQRRLVTLTVLEAMRCLAEGVVGSEADLDCALCLAGWATHRGGPLGYARQLGRDAFLAQIELLTREYGSRYALPAGPILGN